MAKQQSAPLKAPEHPSNALPHPSTIWEQAPPFFFHPFQARAKKSKPRARSRKPATLFRRPANPWWKDWPESHRDPDASPTAKLILFTTYLEAALKHLEDANHQFARVNADDLPDQHRELFARLRVQLPALTSAAKEFHKRAPALTQMLGGEEPRNYLVVFQNNTELRPTGGFVGSYGELTLTRGRVARLHLPEGGSYDLQGTLRTTQAAPHPLRLLNPRWEFQDANWSPDFPTSARQMLEFYEAAGGATADGVIAINATWVAGLLDIVGQVDMPEYQKTLNAENFLFETQKAVEVDYGKTKNRPKTFLADLAPNLLARALEGDEQTLLKALEYAANGLAQKDLQVYMRDHALQKQTLELGWGGELAWTPNDYLMIVDSNLGGGKTDGVI